MAWRLVYSRRATHDMDGLPARDRRTIHDRLGQLATAPASVDLAKLGGARNRWRLRSGNWRAILTLDAEAGIIEVERVLNRRDAYR